MRKICRIRYLHFLLLLLVYPSYAQLDNSELLDLSMEELLNVEVVTGNKSKEKILETPSFVNTISASEIELLNFTNLQEVLEYVTGISSVNGEGNIFNTTTVRGNTLVNYNTNTLLLVDGIPIYSPYGGSFELSSVPLSSIERVEIVKGSNSVLYGTNAVNATINVITKKVPSYKDEKFKSEILFGENKTLYGNSFLLGRRGDFTFTGAVDYYSTKGEELIIKDELGNTISFAQNKKTFAFVGKINYKDLFRLHIQTYNRNIPNFRTRGFQFIINKYGNRYFIPHRNDEFGLVVNGDFNYSFSVNHSIHIRSEYFDWELNRDNLGGSWLYSSYLFSNDIEYKFNYNKITSNIAGISFNLLKARRYKTEINDYDIGKDNNPTIDFALFLNGSILLFNDFKLFYGGRFYNSKYKDVSISDFSKRFALTYKVSRMVFLKINYGESFRVPTYFEKEVNSALVIGNPDLQPEKSRSIDLIFSHMFQKIKFDVDYFYYDIHDKITRVNCHNDPVKKVYENVGTAEFYGVEIDSKFHFSNNFWGFGGYAYTVGRDKDTKEKLPYSYRNMVNLGFKIKILRGCTFTSSAKYLDIWGEASSYILLNSGVNIIPWLKSKFKLIIQLNNIFNSNIDLPEIARNSEEVRTIPKTYERNMFVGISYGF